MEIVAAVVKMRTRTSKIGHLFLSLNLGTATGTINTSLLPTDLDQARPASNDQAYMLG